MKAIWLSCLGILSLCRVLNAQTADLSTPDRERLFEQTIKKEKYSGKDAFVFALKPSLKPIRFQGSVKNAVPGDTLILMDEPMDGGPPLPPKMVSIGERGAFAFEVQGQNERRLTLETEFGRSVTTVYIQPIPQKPEIHLETALCVEGTWSSTGSHLTTPVTNDPVTALAIRGEYIPAFAVTIKSVNHESHEFRLPASDKRSITTLIPLEPGPNEITLQGATGEAPETVRVEFHPPSIFTLPHAGPGPGDVFATEGKSFAVSGKISCVKSGPIQCSLGSDQFTGRIADGTFSGDIKAFSTGELKAYVSRPPAPWGADTGGPWLLAAILPLKPIPMLASLQAQPVSRYQGNRTATGTPSDVLSHKPIDVNSPHVQLTGMLNPYLNSTEEYALQVTTVHEENTEFKYSTRFDFRDRHLSKNSPGGKDSVILVFPGKNHVEWILSTRQKELERGAAIMNCGPDSNQGLWACMCWSEPLNDLDLHTEVESGSSRNWLYHKFPGEAGQAHLMVSDTDGPGVEVFVVPRGAIQPRSLQFAVRFDSKQHIDNNRPYKFCDVWLYVYKDQNLLTSSKVKMEMPPDKNISKRLNLGGPVVLQP